MLHSAEEFVVSGFKSVVEYRDVNNSEQRLKAPGFMLLWRHFLHIPNTLHDRKTKEIQLSSITYNLKLICMSASVLLCI